MAICSCGLPAHCCQPAFAGGIIYVDLWGELNTHLALQALFTQSPVSETLLQAFPFPSTLEEVTPHPLSLACMLIYSSCGKWDFPPSCGVFIPPPLSQALLLLVAGHRSLLPLEPLWSSSACLFTVPGWIALPPSLALLVPHPLCNVSLLFLLLITQFLFFPRVEVCLSRGLCCSGPGLSVGVPHTTKLTLSAYSQAVWLRVTGSLGALLVYPFNVKWRFSVPAGGVEGSQFCLFSVVLPARCVSSFSPRFHYRRHAFCFLPLATILESLRTIFLIHLPISDWIIYSLVFNFWCCLYSLHVNPIK
jgi:hypothetical protein